MSGGKLRDLAIGWGPWAAAGGLLAANLITCAAHLAEDYHGLLDVALALACFWLVARHYGGPRLRDGERIVSAETYAADQKVFAELIVMSHGQDCAGADDAPPRGLRAV